jgi:hypothetical protein
LSAGSPLAARPLDLPEDPQAAIAREQVIAVSAIDTLLGWLLRSLLLRWMAMSWRSFRLFTGPVLRRGQ